MSFKRRTDRPTAPATLVSTGLPSLDDILGGGLPLSCSLVLIAPDLHTEYGELVQRYFVAQGLASQQHVCIVGPADWVHGCMWLSADAAMDSDVQPPSEEKVKIAWRYEQMKQFQTTVATSATTSADACRTFDLSVRIPSAVVAGALADSRLSLVPVDTPERVLVSLTNTLASHTAPLRICIPAFGSPYWGDLKPQDVLYFLHRLRALLRRHPHACASTNLAAELSPDSAGWHQKLGWISDGAITMTAFTSDPALAAAFPALHGLVHINALPAPRGLVPASDRFSTLRGAAMGGGENNLGFKCTRKRLMFETLHLNVEGGVAERRTSAPATIVQPATAPAPRRASDAVVRIQVEGSTTEAAAATVVMSAKQGKKGGKKVGFQSDRPEVYDF
ncbi:PAXNEB-domain-containing protein [Mycena pura]|uniref:Elongator complex protein 4 n=1 Tax=Mycena pura TaxID=153505 RepID=A0AAD6YPV6_9AGAR|nr:PAXNEB-domain-containing protein [Mycena pura]